MASEIEFQTINEQYPVAGVDNDTQGFRDNFSVIKVGLATANTEISELQTSTVKLDQPNNFQGSELIDAHLNQCTIKTNTGEAEVVADTVINYTNGQYQKFVVSSSAASEIIFELTGWPDSDETSRYASMRIELSTTAEYSDTALTELVSNVTGISWIVDGGGKILADQNWPTPFTLDSAVNSYLTDDSTVDDGGPIVVEFFTYDGGSTVFARYLGTFSVVV